MMTKIILEIPDKVYKTVWSHLLPKKFLAEEAAFIFAQRITEDGINMFRCLDWSPVPPYGFLTRSRFYLELANETRAAAIKRAHDLGASLVELHSHYGLWPAQFSESDLFGFKEFVPHIWWRLKNRPYMAIVVSKSGFDGLAWISDPKTANYIDGIVSGGLEFAPTKLSRIRDDLYDVRTL
jgi:hypothetical protein